MTTMKAFILFLAMIFCSRGVVDGRLQGMFSLEAPNAQPKDKNPTGGRNLMMTTTATITTATNTTSAAADQRRGLGEDLWQEVRLQVSNVRGNLHHPRQRKRGGSQRPGALQGHEMRV